MNTHGALAFEARQGRRAGELAVLLLIGAEAMLFAGLVSAFLVFRISASAWPPLGQPRLPVAATALNTALLLASLALLPAATSRLAAGKPGGMNAAPTMVWGKILPSLLLGSAFVALQGREWLALIAHGLDLRQGPYGAFFTVILMAHGLHCLAGLAWLAGAAALRREEGLRLAGWFWAFVVLLWPGLYAVVYLW